MICYSRTVLPLSPNPKWSPTIRGRGNSINGFVWFYHGWRTWTCVWPNDPYKELPLADLSIFISATAMPELRTYETKKEWAHRFGQVRLLRAFSLFRARHSLARVTITAWCSRVSICWWSNAIRLYGIFKCHRVWNWIKRRNRSSRWVQFSSFPVSGQSTGHGVAATLVAVSGTY